MPAPPPATPSRRAALALLAALWFWPAAAEAAWNMIEAERTIAFGLSAIIERHLQPVTAASLSLDAMRGLSEIDPQLAVSIHNGVARLSTPDATLGEYPTPGDTDTAGWARVVVSAITDARKGSETLRAAGEDQLYQAVFEGALGKADVYSRYAGPAEAREHRANRNGFGGIGIKFDLVNDEPGIIEVIEDTPAARSGMRTGDVILVADGQAVHGLDRNGISALLRGAVGSELALVLRRGAEVIQVTLRRSLIVPRSVTMTLAGPIAEFRITSFNQRTAYSLEGLLKDAKARLGRGLTGVVLDLRGNPGGLLDKAVATADLFMEQGTIVSTRGRHPEAGNIFEAHSGDIGEDLPVVVLVDGRSASAAEILASALQDSGRAVVIGTNSYGKGTVQTVIGLPNDGEITLTWSRFHTPSGYALHGLGVLPTLCTSQLTQPPQAILDGLSRGTVAARLPETLAVWRRAGLDESALRQKLRDTCPPARRSDAKSDMDLAEKILLNRTAYAKALSLAAPERTLEAYQPRSTDPATGPH